MYIKGKLNHCFVQWNIENKSLLPWNNENCKSEKQVENIDQKHSDEFNVQGKDGGRNSTWHKLR